MSLYFKNKQYRAALVAVPNRSWHWARRSELRVRRADDPRPLKGKGCHAGLYRLHEDLDARYVGPRSELGRTLAQYGFQGALGAEQEQDHA